MSAPTRPAQRGPHPLAAVALVGAGLVGAGIGLGIAVAFLLGKLGTAL